MAERDGTTERDGPVTATLSQASRRTVLLGAGALGAAGILAACGDETAPPSTPSTTTGAPGVTSTQAPGAEPTEEAPAQADLATSEVPMGGGVILKDRNVVVTQPAAGEFRAFSSTCTHMQCQVSSISDKITCDCHGSQYSIDDGSVVRGPATQPLPPRAVTVNGDELVLG